MSSMQSAPAHMPAISVASFGAGLADPDLIRGVVIETFSPSSLRQSGLSARAITGTRPASDTRLSSSNIADSAANLCETCTRSAFPNWIGCCLENTNHPSSEGTFLATRRWRRVLECLLQLLVKYRKRFYGKLDPAVCGDRST